MACRVRQEQFGCEQDRRVTADTAGWGLMLRLPHEDETLATVVLC